MANKWLANDVLIFSGSTLGTACNSKLLFKYVAELFKEMLPDCKSMIGKVKEYFDNRNTTVSKILTEANHLPESLVFVQCCWCSNKRTTRCLRSPPEAAIAMFGIVWWR